MMKQTFYATHVIEYLETLDATAEANLLIEKIRSSVKFRLPDGGDIPRCTPCGTELISVFNKTPFRLPYSCICCNMTLQMD